MAFVVYSAPTNFVRNGSGDSAKSSRRVSLEVRSNTVPTYSLKVDVEVYRPPVVLVHGLWGSKESWNGFNPFLSDSRFYIKRVDYSEIVEGITAISPAYSNLNIITYENALGLKYNATTVERQVTDFIKEFRVKNNVAAIQADLAAHSMGGVVSLTMGRSRGFFSPNTYGLGPVHKLITIGTPYWGSPLASGLMKGNNCVRNRLAENGMVSLRHATINGISISGAVHDLEGDGTGNHLSQALKALQGKRPFPCAQIAGIENASNLQDLGCLFCKAFLLRTLCGTIARNPIAQALTPQGWPGLFGQDSDGIVPLSSQLSGMIGSPFNGVIHTDAQEELGFIGPSELEFAGIQTKVIDLLDEPNNGPDFH